MSIFATLNAPLGLWNLPISRSQYREEMFNALADPKTLIFLDTNVLALPFRLHRRARLGLYRLLQKPVQDKRLVVPGWVANEYFHNAFLKASTHGFSESVQKLADRIPTQSEVVQHLRRATSIGEQTYLADKLGVTTGNGVDLISTKLEQIKALLGNVGKELSPSEIHDELISELPGSFVHLDFSNQCNNLSVLAERRRANRIPPGLTDARKSQNADGDLAIWLEILEIASKRFVEIQAHGEEEGAKKPAFERVLLLTQEQKSDYVYAPKTRIRDDDPTKIEQNVKPEIWVIDPRLASEFEARLGSREIAISTIDHIAAGGVATIPGGDPKKEIGDLLAELTLEQNPTTPTEEGGSTLVSGDGSGKQVFSDEPADTNQDAVPADVAPPPPQEQIVETARPRLEIPEAAESNEKEFVTQIDDPIYRKIIDGLNTHNWYMQNDVVSVLIENSLPQNLGWCFVLGRALYQAAVGNAWQAIDLLLALDHPEADIRQQSFIAGAAYEIFFDPTGNLRETFKARFLREVIAMLEKPYYAVAREFIVERMRRFSERFYWLPGEPHPEVEVVIRRLPADEALKIAEVIVRVEGFADQNILRQEEEDGLAWLYSNSMSLDALITNVSDRVLVSPEAIRVVSEPANVVLTSNVKLDAADGLVFDTEILELPVRLV
ncbi:hypothetical protein H3V53_36940 [Paraburkholderia bengalensis]|uniref:PIN like domain-containing protein n=1 Tax=Paraburkholderia bengalensis TaxID=2747562 RepID=A0ABU8J4A9_9BURK